MCLAVSDQHKTNSAASLEGLCTLILSQRGSCFAFVLSYKSYEYISWLLVLYFHRTALCVSHPYKFLVNFFGSFSFVALFYPNLFPLYNILFYFTNISYMPVCFLISDRKGVELDERGGVKELGGVGGRANWKQYIVRKKLFSIKRKKKK